MLRSAPDSSSTVAHDFLVTALGGKKLDLISAIWWWPALIQQSMLKSGIQTSKRGVQSCATAKLGMAQQNAVVAIA